MKLTTAAATTTTTTEAAVAFASAAKRIQMELKIDLFLVHSLTGQEIKRTGKATEPNT